MQVSKLLLPILLSISIVISSHIGQIAYFDDKCPDGWEEFKDSSGRVIVSQGSVIDSLGKTRNFILKELGGEFSHALNISEMAAHQHKTGVAAWDNTYGGGTYIERNGATQGTRAFYLDTNTSKVGEGTPFNIMQPYIVLVACKCLEKADQNKQILSLQEQIANLQKMLYDMQGNQIEILKNQLDIKKDQVSQQSALNDVSTNLYIQYSGQTSYNVSSVFSLVMVSSSLLALLSFKIWQFIVQKRRRLSSFSKPPRNVNEQQQQSDQIVKLGINI